MGDKIKYILTIAMELFAAIQTIISLIAAFK